MKLPRLQHDPGALADFFEEALSGAGALCERIWHDRLQVIADGRSARPWNDSGALHEVELRFTPADSTTERDAARDVFPGCPLTFRLAETIRPSPLPLERIVLADNSTSRSPSPDVAEKLWRAQLPDTGRWRLETPFASAHHFSLVALARCEIQAIDQHWSLRRVAISLPDGELDEALAASLDFAQCDESAGNIAWPAPDPARWHQLLTAALMTELDDDLGSIRARQENYLRRELDRIETYFDEYERELATRAHRTGSESTKVKSVARLEAARAERARRRADQVARHEIRVHPTLEALLLLAEPAWQATVHFVAAHTANTRLAQFIPRSRRWAFMGEDAATDGQDRATPQ
jgi:hypothetical protein